MFLIMSAAYVGVELQSEFGAIPPSLLPLGNRRLFQHQHALIPAGVTKYLSLPESYSLSKMDADWLAANDITVLPLPDGLSLGAALVAALNLVDSPLDKPLHVLFGDTLITPLPTGNDIVSVSDVENSYNWARINQHSTQEWLSDSSISLTQNTPIVSGYFKFSQPRQLMKCLTKRNWHFLEGLNLYKNEIGLQTVKSDNWLDFGHVNTYYTSKAKFTTQRAFNELVITPEWIEKSSSKNIKIKAEANWFEHLPATMRNFIPQFMGCHDDDGKFKYRLEYLHHTALNELYVFSELPPMVWKNIFSGCLNFIAHCQQHHAKDNDTASSLNNLFGAKTKERLMIFCDDRQFSLDDKWLFNDLSVSINEILATTEQWLPQNEDVHTVMHGDFCFSNILYDFRTNRIKTIDPRGLTHDNVLTIFGDSRYDIAKLSHSVLGMYDWIIAGYYHVNIQDNTIQFDIAGLEKQRDIQQLFVEAVSQTCHLSPMNLYAMQIHLFLSMLPLHDDDKQRQDALFANAFRLYQILVGYTQ
ncbi:capsular biosynthesis protein [Photobacterium japonica]|uniref:capsular biosynthesis protein n=1 Tax=Photobacterium japonica TaxID=2910235 RepID=UPI003D10F17A